MNFTLDRYVHSPGDLRLMVTVLKGVGWVAFYPAGGSGVEIKSLTAGESWREGHDEYIGVFETEDQARAAG